MQELDGDDAKVRVLIAATATEYSTLRISGNPAGSLPLQLERTGGVALFSSPP